MERVFQKTGEPLAPKGELISSVIMKIFIKKNTANITNLNSPLGVRGSFSAPTLGGWGAAFGVVLLCLLLASCSGTKHLPKGEKLYTGADIKLESTEKIDNGFIKAIAEEAFRPEPNASYLGMRPQLLIYQSATENPRSKLQKWLRKMGDAPVLISAVKPAATAAIIDAKLFNIGIFKSYTDFKIVEKKHTASVIYTSHIHKPYLVKDITYSISNDSLSSLIVREKKYSILKSGQEYNLDILKSERMRIDASLKNNGYFYFNPDYLVFKADTSTANRTISFKVTLKDSIPRSVKSLLY